MTLFWKKLFKRRKAFTMIEMLVALSIIGFAVSATLTVFINLQKYMHLDKDMARVVEFTDGYFSRLYLSQDLRADLLSAEELDVLSNTGRYPVLMPPIETNIGNRIAVYINRKINRLDPLLADIGIECRITYAEVTNSEMATRKYWIETTIAESYLKKLE